MSFNLEFQIQFHVASYRDSGTLGIGSETLEDRSRWLASLGFPQVEAEEQRKKGGGGFCRGEAKAINVFNVHYLQIQPVKSIQK